MRSDITITQKSESPEGPGPLHLFRGKFEKVQAQISRGPIWGGVFEGAGRTLDDVEGEFRQDFGRSFTIANLTIADIKLEVLFSNSYRCKSC